MTVPKSFAPVRMPCAHYPDFCPRNAVEGSDRCELHQQRVVAEAAAVAPPPLALQSLPPIVEEDDDCDSLDGLLVGGRRVRSSFRRPPPEPRQALLPFCSEGGGRVLQASPQRPFKPRGLMLWNAGELSVEATYVGNSEQLLCSWGKVPAAWWSTQQSFEEVCKALAEGKEAASWGTWDHAYPGVMVRLTFDGDCAGVRAVMWGVTL